MILRGIDKIDQDVRFMYSRAIEVLPDSQNQRLLRNLLFLLGPQHGRRAASNATCSEHSCVEGRVESWWDIELVRYTICVECLAALRGPMDLCCLSKVDSKKASSIAYSWSCSCQRTCRWDATCGRDIVLGSAGCYEDIRDACLLLVGAPGSALFEDVFRVIDYTSAGRSHGLWTERRGYGVPEVALVLVDSSHQAIAHSFCRVSLQLGRITIV